MLPAVDPATSLLWFGLVATAMAVLFWPGRGVVARIARLRRLSERVLVEDALKQLINGELAGQPVAVTSLAGALEIARWRAHVLASRLAALGLAAYDEPGLRLTPEGRTYALRILRTHRLLERYFADHTGLAPAQWHPLAETREHALTEGQVEALAARLGDPLRDPHGDPIPTAQGKLPPLEGVSLATLAPGATANVVHVEDEPEPVYRRLVAAGFVPAAPIKVIAKEGSDVHVLVGGRATRLEDLEAAGVTVEPVAEAEGHTVLFERLDLLRPGESAEVVDLAPEVQGPQRRRLLDLGVLPGTRITAEFRSASGDPIAYLIRGALVALRRPQAHGIYIRRHPLEAAVVAAAGEAAS